jgi:hypothetical protein
MSIGGVVVVAVAIVALGCESRAPVPAAPTDATTPRIDSTCTDPTLSGTPACPAAASLGVGIRINSLVAGADTPFTYTIAGLTVSGSGTRFTAFTGLAPGDYDVTGQVQEQLIVTAFRMVSTITGGFDPNSLQHLAGPLFSRSCSGGTGNVTYLIPAGGIRPQTFRFKITISASSSFTPCVSAG